MEPDLLNYRLHELRKEVVFEIRKFITMLDSDTSVADLEKQRDLIRTMFEKWNKKEQEEFLSLFEGNYLHGLLE